MFLFLVCFDFLLDFFGFYQDYDHIGVGFDPSKPDNGTYQSQIEEIKKKGWKTKGFWIDFWRRESNPKGDNSICGILEVLVQ